MEEYLEVADFVKVIAYDKQRYPKGIRYFHNLAPDTPKSIQEGNTDTLASDQVDDIPKA